MNLFKELVITAPVSNRLQFGFNENIIISAIDTTERKIKGLPIKANTFITLSQVDPETRKVVAQNEFNYWNLDPTTDFVVSNFIDQFTSLASILDALGKDASVFEMTVLTALGADTQEVDVTVKTKDGAKLAQNTLQNTFYDMAKDSIGAACPLLKMKLVCNKKGWLELPKVMGAILPMTSTEALPDVTSQEKRIHAEALTATAESKVVKPDTLGGAKPGVATAEKAVAKPGAFAGL
jgi:hypothetical protein